MKYFIIKAIMRYNSRRATSAKYRGIRRWGEQSAERIKLPEKCILVKHELAGIPADWISYSGVESDRVILYLHGGGYVFCSPRTHSDLILRLARASKARAVAIDYRLAPENPHPAAVEDALAAYKCLLDNGTDPSRIAVMGDSAGGGLALVLLQTLRDRKMPLPACAVCMSPWADLTCSGESFKKNSWKDPVLPSKTTAEFARMYQPEGDLALPSVSPLFGDFSNLPPILIHVGTNEILLDDSRRIAEKAAKTNTIVEIKVWPKMIHIFQMLSVILPEARQSIREIGQFVEKHIPDIKNEFSN